jgi:cellulose synthase/poly-beta-1,6-N-acetylglucosamine synthase-like glycosyltransferase
MTVRFSVVIPCYNEGGYIADTINSLAAQSFSGGCEIIVVDNNCTDDTAEMARGLGARVVAEAPAPTRVGEGFGHHLTSHPAGVPGAHRPELSAARSSLPAPRIAASGPTGRVGQARHSWTSPSQHVLGPTTPQPSPSSHRDRAERLARTG